MSFILAKDAHKTKNAQTINYRHTNKFVQEVYVNTVISINTLIDDAAENMEYDCEINLYELIPDDEVRLRLQEKIVQGLKNAGYAVRHKVSTLVDTYCSDSISDAVYEVNWK